MLAIHALTRFAFVLGYMSLTLLCPLVARADTYRYRLIKAVPNAYELEHLGFSGNDRYITYLFVNKRPPYSWSFERHDFITKKTKVLYKQRFGEQSVQVPLLSSDGRYIAFVTYQDFGGVEGRLTPDIHIFDTKQKTFRPVTHWKIPPPTKVRCEREHCGSVYPIQFSPDNKFLFYQTSFEGLSSPIPYSLSQVTDPESADWIEDEKKLVAYEMETGIHTVVLKGYDCRWPYHPLPSLAASFAANNIFCSSQKYLTADLSGTFPYSEIKPEHSLEVPLVAPKAGQLANEATIQTLMLRGAPRLYVNPLSSEISVAPNPNTLSGIPWSDNSSADEIKCSAMNEHRNLFSYIVAKQNHGDTRALEWREMDLRTGITRTLPIIFKLASLKIRQGSCAMMYTINDTKIIGAMTFEGWMAGKQFENESFVLDRASNALSFPSQKAGNHPAGWDRGREPLFSKDLFCLSWNWNLRGSS